MDIRRRVSRSNISETLRAGYYRKGLDRPGDKPRNFVPVFSESALRHLHSHPALSFSLSFPISLSLSLSPLFCPRFLSTSPLLSPLPCVSHPPSYPFTIPLFNLSSIGAAKRDAGLAPKMDSGIEGSAVGFSRLYSRRELYGISRDSSVLRLL